jgi:hypothetical protein
MKAPADRATGYTAAVFAIMFVIAIILVLVVFRIFLPF